MKLRKVTQNDPTERLAVSIRQSTSQMLESYQAFYHRTYGESIERSQLVEEILREFMTGDKGFQKHLSAGTSAAPKALAANPPVSSDTDGYAG